MAIKKIEQSIWQEYFDSYSKSFLQDNQPEYAEIHILSDTSGILPEISWCPLEGITYDSERGILNIKVESLDHMIVHPTEIYVDEEENGWITSMEIVEKDGTKNIIEIR